MHFHKERKELWINSPNCSSGCIGKKNRHCFISTLSSFSCNLCNYHLDIDKGQDCGHLYRDLGETLILWRFCNIFPDIHCFSIFIIIASFLYFLSLLFPYTPSLLFPSSSLCIM